MIDRTPPPGAVWLCVALLAATAGDVLRSSSAPVVQTAGIGRYPDVDDLHELTDTFRARHRMPAVGAGVVYRGAIAGLGLSGERVEGSGNPATLDDLFDVGAVAESVTATVAAILVEEGRIRWDTTLAEGLPDLIDMHPAYANVTLELLLQHRAGLAFAMSRNDRWRRWHAANADRSPMEARMAFAANVLRRPPAFEPGTATHLSSDGYVIAGAMLERAAGVPWVSLVRTRLFEPLGLTSMRYGTSEDAGEAPPIVGHELGWFGRSVPVRHDPTEFGAPPFGAPAGFLYASIPDLLRWIDAHIQGANGRSRLLSAASFRRLHTPPDGRTFALGWETDRTPTITDRGLERHLRRTAATERFRAGVWFVPEAQWGAAVVANSGRGTDHRLVEGLLAALEDARETLP